MSKLFTIAFVIALVAATGVAQAEPRTRSGAPEACKAPWGEPFGLGETIQLRVLDAKGDFVTVTYQCTENGWNKVARIGPSTGGAGPLRLAPGMLQQN